MPPRVAFVVFFLNIRDCLLFMETKCLGDIFTFCGDIEVINTFLKGLVGVIYINIYIKGNIQ